jgi:hypothetical protein
VPDASRLLCAGRRDHRHEEADQFFFDTFIEFDTDFTFIALIFSIARMSANWAICRDA